MSPSDDPPSQGPTDFPSVHRRYPDPLLRPRHCLSFSFSLFGDVSVGVLRSQPSLHLLPRSETPRVVQTWREILSYGTVSP